MADMLELPQLPDIFPLSFDVDSMVDDSITNTCTLFDEDNCLSSIVQVQNTQDKSPFHESDSGVSEVSEFAQDSPGHSEPMLDEMIDNMNTNSIMIDGNMNTNSIMIDGLDDHDEDLMAYLAGDSESNNNRSELESLECPVLQSGRQTRSKSALAKDSQKEMNKIDNGSNQSVEENRFTPRVVLRGRRSLISGGDRNNTRKCQESSDSMSNDDSDIEVIDTEKVQTSSKSRAKGSVRVGKPGSTLPSKSTSTTTNSTTGCNVTSVKVLRIVNSGKSSNPEDDVVKALEERNRKNAEMAKLNRQKKKMYVSELEEEVKESRAKVDQLEAQLNDVEEERDSFKRQVEYLKSVLANQSALAGLLKNIPSTTGVRLSSSASRKRVAELDHCYTPTKKPCSSTHSTAGVCLHVDNDSVSLEFCHHCAEMAHDGGSH